MFIYEISGLKTPKSGHFKGLKTFFGAGKMLKSARDSILLSQGEVVVLGQLSPRRVAISAQPDMLMQNKSN